MTKPRLLVAASGTGGHIFPALAVAHELTEFDIQWLGVPDRLETKLVPEQYPLHTIALQGLDRKPGLQWMRAAAQALGAFRQVRSLIECERYAAVFTTGGYIAAPAVFAARTRGIPAIGHESNVLPGKVTRALAGSMAALGLGFAEAADHLPGVTTRWVGTPVRDEFLHTPNPLTGLDIPETATLIVAFGGSQGARGLNRLITECAPTWLERGYWLVHLAGQGEYDAVRAAAPQHPAYTILSFWERMAALLGRADLAISRAGAGTLSELLITGTPSILLPYPYAAEDHQRLNGEVLVRTGAALQFDQLTLTAATLERTVISLLEDNQALRTMGERARALARPDAARRMADLVRESVEARDRS